MNGTRVTQTKLGLWEKAWERKRHQREGRSREEGNPEKVPGGQHYKTCWLLATSRDGTFHMLSHPL